MGNNTVYNSRDEFIIQFDSFLHSLFSSGLSWSHPAEHILDDRPLTEKERTHSAGLMRVNHTGEICAQALYQGQALTTPSHHAKQVLLNAAQDERSHLSWCKLRLNELNDRTSFLNPFWYGASFCMGAVIGFLGERISLGFVHATERGVEQHLAHHLDDLPVVDQRSRAILLAMQEDEIHHGQSAIAEGGVAFSAWSETLMRWIAKPMTTISYWI